MKNLLCIAVLVTFAIRAQAQIEVVSGGNVGVGTASPGAKLEVVDATAANGVVAKLTRNSKSLQFYSGSMVDLQLGTPGNHSLGFYTNNSNPLITLTPGQNVGVGTTTPGWIVAGFTNLDVRGSTQAGLVTVSSSAADGDYVQLGQFAFVDRNTTSGLPAVARIVAQLSGPTANNRGSYLTLSTKKDNGVLTDALVIDRNQNVGIGTFTPGYKLEVVGTVRATNFISNTTTYADFVFDPGYKLPSLGEVEAHIIQLGHLPGIPSESEVKEHGIDLASMQVKLLQKVEELTLYVIDLKKENAELHRRAERLERISAP